MTFGSYFRTRFSQERAVGESVNLANETNGSKLSKEGALLIHPFIFVKDRVYLILNRS